MLLRFLIIAVFVVCCASATAAPAGSRTTEPEILPKVDPKAASVRVLRCVGGGPATSRLATFRAAMVAIEGTETMQVRFKLQERDASGRRTIKAPGLGVWRKSRPGLGRFAYRQRVLALEPGYSYQVIVQYRWYDGDGELLGIAKRRSASCGQGRKLPNLVVEQVVVTGPGPAANTLHYRVTVSNRGQAKANGVEVALAVDDSELDRVPIGSLSSGESGRAGFVGPACAASLKAGVDPGGLIQEVSETDNAKSLPCSDAQPG